MNKYKRISSLSRSELEKELRRARARLSIMQSEGKSMAYDQAIEIALRDLKREKTYLLGEVRKMKGRKTQESLWKCRYKKVRTELECFLRASKEKAKRGLKIDYEWLIERIKKVKGAYK